MRDRKLIVMVVLYFVGVINGWIGGYEYAQRHMTEVNGSP